MRKLSTGQDSTLESYRDYCAVVFGEDSAATRFIDDKISKSGKGAKEEVIADEVQLLHVLAQIHVKGKTE